MGLHGVKRCIRRIQESELNLCFACTVLADKKIRVPEGTREACILGLHRIASLASEKVTDAVARMPEDTRVLVQKEFQLMDRGVWSTGPIAMSK